MPHPHLQRELRPLLLLQLPVSLGHRVVEELVDAVDDVGAHQGEAAEAAAVHHADGQGRAVDLLENVVYMMCYCYFLMAMIFVAL